MKRSLVLLATLVIGGVVVPLVGQQQADQKPLAFEVASIEPTDAVERGGGSAGLQPGGRFVLKNGPVRVLINMAFQTQTGEMSGAPDWVTYGEHYDVDARAGHELNPKELAPLLRQLLVDRFKLRARLETRVRPMYELRVLRTDGKLGPQLKPSSATCVSRPTTCTTHGGAGIIDSNEMSMAEFVTWLPGIIGRPVLEKTGLSGRYELLLRFSQTEGAELPSLPTALREQLGLTLESIEAPTDVLVIDHVERPTPD